MANERVLEFSCNSEQLLGILSEGERAGKVGVVIVVGGPQYRVGSHRQFTLLARDLANAGFPCLRFDHRGMGDSAGDSRSFEELQDDISVAIDALFHAVSGLRHVVLWGLCDAASSILMYWYATRDRRIVGMCLLNPWVRSEQTQAEMQVKHYYRSRFAEPDFWRKVFRGKVSLIRSVFEYLSKQKFALAVSKSSFGFQFQMSEALAAFPGSVLLIISGRDYTGVEFKLWLAQPSQQAARERSNFELIDVPEADHTFSSFSGRRSVVDALRSWLSRFAVL
jgi:uncharacterized protein